MNSQSVAKARGFPGAVTIGQSTLPLPPAPPVIISAMWLAEVQQPQTRPRVVVHNDPAFVARVVAPSVPSAALWGAEAPRFPQPRHASAESAFVARVALPAPAQWSPAMDLPIFPRRGFDYGRELFAFPAIPQPNVNFLDLVIATAVCLEPARTASCIDPLRTAVQIV